MSDWRKEHKDLYNRQRRQSYQQNKDKITEKRNKNREKINKDAREYYAKNKEHLLKQRKSPQQKKWRKEYYKRNNKDYMRRHAVYDVGYRIRMKYECVKMLGFKCELCGYNKNPFLMHFHHKGDKFGNVSEMIGTLGSSKQKIFNEVKKCSLLCPTCHDKIHAPVAILWEKNPSIDEIIKILKDKKIEEMKKKNGPVA